jgi:hypothetical protein
MITITFTPETPAQADIVAKLMGAYLMAGDAVPADPETAAVEAAPAPAKKGKPKAAPTPVAEATSSTPVAAATETPASAPAAEAGNVTPAATSTASPTASTAPSQDSTVTLEQVRAKLAALSQAGKAAQVKGLIAQFGVMKLTDVPADKYAKLMDEASALEAA